MHHCWVLVYLGDGNLHGVSWVDQGKGAASISLCRNLRLGISLEKKACPCLGPSSAEINLMRSLQQALDPNTIFNNVKIF